MGDTGNADGRTFNSSGAAQYSVPAETLKTLQEEILSNPLVAPDLPPEIAEAAAQIKFTGSDSPSLPVNWRLAEAVASLKGLEAAVVNVLLHRKYGLPFQPVTINTDHATLFVMSTVLWTVDPGQGGLNITASNLRAVKGLDQFFPSYDKHGVGSSLYRALATNIYRTADGRYYHFHNSLDSKPTQDCLGLPHDIDVSSYDEAAKPYVEAVSQLRSEDLDHKYAEEYRQAGTICYSTEEYLNSEQGKANAHVGLWEIRDRTTAAQPPSWWPDSPQTGPNRPLAGLKVVDLTRIIAAPTVTRNLAELGASIMRCTSPNLPDVSSLHVDLNWGKWNSSIDLHSEEDRAKLKALILEADVVVQSYRPGVLDKYGFGQEDILKMCEDRPQGIIYARLNCFGWNGPWQERSGWQQIGDASTGISLSFGQAMGLNEPVTPIFPHSDYCSGITGSIGILLALLRRGEKGGSFTVDLALNYYNAWLIRSVGTYPRDYFDKVWGESDRKVYRHFHNNSITVPEVVGRLKQGPAAKRIFKPEFWVDRPAVATMGPQKKIRVVKGIADWNGAVNLDYNVGTRPNGVDAARWPEDLSVEVVS